MINTLAEKSIGRTLAFGAPFCSMFLLITSVTDPVNSTKLWVTSGLGIGVLGLALFYGAPHLRTSFRWLLFPYVAFNIFSLWASVMSASPFSQNFYGIYGRNTGFLTYFVLSCLAVASVLVSSYRNFELIWKGFLVTGLVNVSYCSWVIAFGDFLAWNNPYKKILGLFGNPDFISAFLGMFVTGIVAYIFSPIAKRRYQIVGIVLIPINIYLIIQSHAIQGLVVSAGGLCLVLFFKVYAIAKRKIYVYLYSIAVAILGTLAVFGTLQKGPFSFVYKRSVSFRGTYWRAGIEMGQSHPFTGVGMDSYGDWYRRARPPIALVDTPGKGVMSNVSHNVVIDFFAFGGFPLLLSYLAILLFTSVAIIRVLKRSNGYDYVFVGMTSVWVCYQVQSFISINQIGLALWGWLFGGLLIGYEYATREKSVSVPMRRNRERANNPISPNFVAAIGIGLGLIIGLPAFNADVKFASALRQPDVSVVEKALEPSLFNPPNSQKYGLAIQQLAASNLGQLAHKYILLAVKYNPESFDAWYQLYTFSNSTVTEKEEALRNMKRLDPLNPDVTLP